MGSSDQDSRLCPLRVEVRTRLTLKVRTGGGGAVKERSDVPARRTVRVVLARLLAMPAVEVQMRVEPALRRTPLSARRWTMKLPHDGSGGRQIATGMDSVRSLSLGSAVGGAAKLIPATHASSVNNSDKPVWLASPTTTTTPP